MKRKYILPLLLPVQWLLLKVLSFFPDWVEKHYSTGLYPYLAKPLRAVFGQLPFSVGDILYGITLVFVVVKIYRSRKTWRVDWKSNLLHIASVLSVLYFIFHLLWALNYYRQPLAEKLGIQTEYTTVELIRFTRKLILKTNAVQLQITQDKNNSVRNPYSEELLFTKSLNGYNKLAQTYPYLSYDPPSQKKSFFSLPLTYMGFGGYLNPFTNEAQVNYKLPRYGFPAVVCHEMAHQIGYASESECNFIGFLAGIKNDDLYFQYSAYAGALRYCLNHIALQDAKQLEILKKQINPGILKNYEESERFWAQYDTFIDKGFHAFYDQYLKWNQQQDGIESYSRFVDLLVNYYKQEKW